jgi:hypothetical protein
MSLSLGLSGGKRLRVINRKKNLPIIKSKGDKNAYKIISPNIPNIATNKSSINFSSF